MKKMILLPALTLLFSPLYSLPLGNPALPTLFNGNCCDQIENDCGWRECLARWKNCLGINCFSVGYYGDFVFQRNLENTSFSASAHNTTITTNAGLLSLNFRNWLDIFGTLGATKIDLQAYGVALENPTGNAFAPSRLYTIDFNYSLSWSVGGRAVLWKCNCFGLGVEGQYFTSNQDFNYIYDTGTFLEYRNNSMRYQEWQLGLGAYYTMEFASYPLLSAVPYVGIKFAHAHLDMGNTFIRTPIAASTRSVTLNDFDSARDFGYAIGSTLTFCQQFNVTIEGRFRDESAVYVSGQWCF